MRFPKAGVLLVHVDDNDEPDAIWDADLKQCPICDYQVLSGFGSRTQKFPHLEQFLSRIEHAREYGNMFKFTGGYNP